MARRTSPPSPMSTDPNHNEREAKGDHVQSPYNRAERRLLRELCPPGRSSEDAHGEDFLSGPFLSGQFLSGQERERLRRETARQLRAEFRDYQAARITDQALQLALESAQVAHAAVRAGYDAGTRTITDVLDSERRIAEAQRDLNQARYELLTRLLSLQSVAGTLTRDDVTALDVLFEAR